MSKSILLSAVVSILFSGVSFAGNQVPNCMASGKPIPVNDAQVLLWKNSTKNQFLARGHVAGSVARIYPVQTGHAHFEIQIGPKSEDTLEVIYQLSFGALPPLRTGMKVEACGDYITSNAPSGPYPASPDGAIMHWVHRNPKGHGHDSGFVVVDGVVFGNR